MNRKNILWNSTLLYLFIRFKWFAVELIQFLRRQWPLSMDKGMFYILLTFYISYSPIFAKKRIFFIASTEQAAGLALKFRPLDMRIWEKCSSFHSFSSISWCWWYDVTLLMAADGVEGRECASKVPEVIFGSMLLSGGEVSNSAFGQYNASRYINHVEINNTNSTVGSFTI